MALIAPTTYDADSRLDISEGNQIKQGPWESYLNNQHLSLLAEQMVIADHIWTQTTTSGSYGNARTWPLDTIDTCDFDGGSVLTHKWYYRARVSVFGTVGVIRVQSGADSDTGTVTATTWDWYYGGEIDLTTNGVEDFIQLDLLRSSGAGTVYLNGFLLLATPQ